jgi:hypothetical protein
MPYSGKFLPLGRTAAALAAALVVSSLVNCTAFTATVRDGTLASSADRGRPSKGALIAGAPGTYIEELLVDRDSTIERWAPRLSHPLRVWIDSTETVSGPQAGFPAAVRAAFADWSSTGIPIRVTYVESPGVADIRVRWIDRLNKKTGSTTWRTDHSGWMLAGDITLATHISDGQALDPRGMWAIALHETGHALGLSHSSDPTDVMAALVHVDGLSVSDRNTIKLLYSQPAGTVR